jgi:hypothetical protein
MLLVIIKDDLHYVVKLPANLYVNLYKPEPAVVGKGTGKTLTVGGSRVCCKR